MRNAILQSFTSQHCNFGNNEVQMPNHSDVSVQLDRLDVYGSNFFHGFHVSNDQLNERLDPLSAIQIPQTFSCLPGLLTTATTSMCEHASEPRFVKNFDSVKTARKRTANVCELMESATTMKESKKRKAVFMESQCHYQPTEEPSVTHEQRAPVRRSQKLGDRITALQKLVSPFGKTDTASVLQEAFVYIKLLQDQIHKLSAPYFMPNPYQTQGFGPSCDEGLSSRGLCLVPVSFTQKLAEKEDQHDYSISRRTVIP